MLRLYTSDDMPWPAGSPAPVLSERKLRLFCLAWRDMASMPNQEWTDEVNADVLGVHGSMAGWARSLTRLSSVSQEMQANLLRDVIGNPFAPIRCRQTGNPLGTDTVMIRSEGSLAGCDCRWIAEDVVGLAQAAYGERQSDGTIDPTRLSILADALIDAGCPAEELVTETVVSGYRCPACGDAGTWRTGVHFDHEKICGSDTCRMVWEPGRAVQIQKRVANPLLTHLRSGGVHVRGCWAIDAILNRE